jgi:hypothetical protein
MINKTIAKTIVTGILLIGMVTLQAQAQTRISGFVSNRQSGERLIGASIATETKVTTVSDNSGYFSLVVKIPCKMKISFVGYKTFELNLNSRKDTIVEAILDPGLELQAVIVKGARRLVSNVVSLKINEIREMPTIGGKPDVLKSMQLLPGIQSQNEGSSLLLVRGGDPGQNLYLFDNVPVIYVNHLGGFLSVFNPDIINSIDLYKGGFPARFGGRLSSVVDITQREGDQTRLKGSLGIGITDISFSLEGPMKLKNSSFILTGRKTLTDPLMALFSGISKANDFIVAYGFHDFNGKFTWKPNERNSLHVNIYQGDDYMSFWSSRTSTTMSENSKMRNIWGNWLASARWNHVLSPRIFMSNTLSYSRYRLNFFQSYSVTDTLKHPIFDRDYISSVEDLSLRSNLKIQVLKSWSLETGLQGSYLTHIPNSYYQSNLAVQPLTTMLKTLETALYLDNKINLSARLETNLGLRVISYVSSAFNFLSLEPRVRLSFQVSENLFIHASYQRVTQNEQLLFTSGSIMNNEVWVPADAGINRARSDQYTIGWNGSIRNGQYMAEIIGYYKTMENLATYREGYTSLMGDIDWRSKVVTDGTGRSAGVEFLFRKQYGDWTGFVSYTWSKTSRKFPLINKGMAFVYDFDRPHTASLSISHKLSEKWSFNMVWVYQTGLPYTPILGRQLTLNTEPDEQGNFGYYEVLQYGERNSARMRDYHRLDVGATLNTLTKKGRKATWTFSIYNLYNRHNPYYYYYNTTSNTTDYDRPEQMSEFKPSKLYQMSLFPIIPSVSYKVNFDGIASKTVKKHSTEVAKIGNLQNNRWDIKVGYSSISGLCKDKNGVFKNAYSNFRVEVNYRLFRFAEVGGYLGYSPYSSYLHTNNMLGSYLNTPFIGINVNLKLLPFLSSTKELRFSLYLLGRYGGGIYQAQTTSFYLPGEGFFLNYSHGAGFAVYLMKNIGVFTEFSFIKFQINRGDFRFGLIVRI